MPRRARSARRSPDKVPFAPPSPHIQRALPHFDPLDSAGIERIEAQVDWMLENAGVAFRDDPATLQVWRDAGITPDGPHGDLIRADPKWIRELSANAPRQFTQLARNPDRSATIGGAHQVFAPIYGTPFVRYLHGGRRYATFDDFKKLLKLAYLYANLHHTGLVIAEPTDILVSKRRLDEVLAHMMRNYQTAFYEPALSSSENVKSWEEAVSKDMRVRGHERWNAMLQSYVPPTMDDSARAALQDYVARRKSELPDAWY